jgi:hypothetical protein
MTSTALVFQSTTFDVIDQLGQPWLRGYQIGSALGYTDGSVATAKLYDRNANEFTDHMTAVVKLPTAGGEQDVRIFSLRGCHLLAMLSRTKIAKDFRRWVLDILDRETGAPALPAFITPAQAGELATLIAERFPDGHHRPYAWGRFNNHFRISGYKTLPATRFDEACDYVRQMPRKGEQAALPAPVDAPAKAAADFLGNPTTRLLTTFIKNGSGDLVMVAHTIQENAHIATPDQLVRDVGDPGSFFPRNLLPALIQAAAKRLEASA